MKPPRDDSKMSQAEDFYADPLRFVERLGTPKGKKIADAAKTKKVIGGEEERPPRDNGDRDTF